MVRKVRQIPIEQIVPNPEQPRSAFDEESLRKLADSILEHGLINPVSVEATEDGKIFILEDGERRLRACELAGLKHVEAVVGEARKDGGERLMRALVANLQREDMNAIDEARAFARLMSEFGLKQIDVSANTGHSQLYVSSRLILLKLDKEIQQLIIDGRLPKQKEAVEALLGVKDKEARVGLAKRLATRRATVRGIVQASQRYNKLAATMIEGQARGNEIEGPPAIRSGLRRAKRGTKAPIWEQLHKRQKLPKWELVMEAAERTCRACALYEIASDEVCVECPAAAFVADLVVRAGMSK